MKLFIFLIFLVGACHSFDFNFTILNTNDLHSTFDGVGSVKNRKGHYARISNVIRSLQDKDSLNTLTLDSGDWSSGTLYSTLSASKLHPDLSPELAFFKYSRYDAITLGNHEFDGKDALLSLMLQKGSSQDFLNSTDNHDLPILSSNYRLKNDKTCSSYLPFFKYPYNMDHYTESTSSLSNIGLNGDGNLYFVPYILKQLYFNNQNLKVGVLGFMGPHSAEVCVIHRHCIQFDGYNDENMKSNFTEYSESVFRTIKHLRMFHGVEIVIAIGHSGNPETNKLIHALQHLAFNDHEWDQNIFPRVLDVFLSSHTHKQISTVHPCGTVVYQNNAYGVSLGILNLRVTIDSGRYHIDPLNINSETKPISLTKLLQLPSKDQPMNFKITDLIAKDTVYNNVLLNHYQPVVNEILRKTVNLSFVSEISCIPNHVPEDRIGFAQYVVDSIFEELSKKTDILEDGESPIDAVFYNIDMVRSTPSLVSAFKYEPLSFSDCFGLLGIGDSVDALPGDTIVRFYLTVDDFKLLVWVIDIYTRYIEPLYQSIFSSNLTFNLNLWKIPIVQQRVSDIRIDGQPLSANRSLIHIAAPHTVASFLARSKHMTNGLFEVILRDANGVPISSPIPTSQYPYVLLSSFLSHQNITCLKDNSP